MNSIKPRRAGLQIFLLLAIVLFNFGPGGSSKVQAVVTCYTLTLAASPTVGGTVTANPLPDCNSNTQYAIGTVVTLTAVPNSGYSFGEWQGSVTGTTNPTTVTMDGNKSVTALFPPAHDDFAFAKMIGGITYQDLNVNTTRATQQTFNSPTGADPDKVLCQRSAPSFEVYRGTNTVWYEYLNTTGTPISVSLDTKGSTPSDYDTYIAVWTGTESNLSLVGCNDEDWFGETSFSFIANTTDTYYIEVAHFAGNWVADVPGPTTGNGGLLQFHAYITNVKVGIGLTSDPANYYEENYYLYNGTTNIDSYPSVVNGPVKVKSTSSDNIFTSQRAIFGNSFNELTGFPANQLTTDYWFTYYDDIYMSTWLMIGNADPDNTAHVEVYMGNGSTPIYTDDLAPGESVLPKFGIAGGPVRVISTNKVKIFTSQRAAYLGSFNELMGFPANQLTTDYWFTYYDDNNSYMATWLMIGNPDPVKTAYVEVYMGNGSTPIYTDDLGPGESVLPRLQVTGGPLRVVSTTGDGTPTALPIFTSERSAFGNSFNELMGFPANQLTTDYWYTYYDDVNMNTWLMIGNSDPDNTAHVEVYMGNGSTPIYTDDLDPGESVLPKLGIVGGPVQVKSTNNVKIFTSERVAYGNSFNELMGFPTNQLTTDYWFTYYDNLYMKTNLLIGAPK